MSGVFRTPDKYQIALVGAEFPRPNQDEGPSEAPPSLCIWGKISRSRQVRQGLRVDSSSAASLDLCGPQK